MKWVNMKNVLILEGILILSETEGGFGPIQVEVDGQSLDVAIARMADVYSETDRGGNLVKEYLEVAGNWRITVERL